MSGKINRQGKKKLIFNIGEESLPTIVSEDTYKSAPFADAIDKSLEIMGGLFVKACKDYSIADKSYITSHITSQQHIYPNNIVAFLGDRGSGKTSCLLSALEIFKRNIVNDGKTLNDDILVLDIIDPSFFDNDHNILEFFIGEFYKQFKNDIKKYDNLTTDERNEIKKIQTEFSNVKHAIEFIDTKYTEDPIDELDDVKRLSSGIELSHSLNRLITCYLKFKGKKCLIIVIDDLDLNINASYRMMEQIRMNLVQPNVIILMAAKLEQLKLGIENSLIGYVENKLIDRQEISEMASRYLDKLLPIGHRVFMPASDSFMKVELQIKDNGKDVIVPAMTQYAVLQLIFQKTRFLFYNHEDHASYIIPRNLRELRMLVTALCQMDDPNDKNRSIHEYNKEVFKEYFKDQWLPTLSERYEDFANSLISENAIEKINKKVVDFLISNCQALKSWLNFDGSTVGVDEESQLQRNKLKEITNLANYNANISVGDVMYVLSLVREYDDNTTTERLLFFIQTFYSMLLYELYDEMTDNLDENGVLTIDDLPSTIPLLRKDKATSIPDYLKLVAGSFFTIDGNTFTPTDKFGSSREISLLDGFVLRNEISKLIKDLTLQAGKWKDPTEEQILRMNLIEFFIFCSRRRTLQRSEEYSWRNNDAWRTNLELSYLQSFTNTKNIIFDIAAPFFTMVYPKIAYERYNPKFYELAFECKDSLLYKLLNGRGRRDINRNKFADLMSRACLRNMEVRADIEQFLKRNKTSLRPDKQDTIGILLDFFSRFGKSNSSYSVKTYDKDADNISFHKIEFIPLSQLADVLEKISDDDDLVKLFTKIFSSSDKILSNHAYLLNEFLQRIYSLDETQVEKAEVERLSQYVIEIYQNLGNAELRSENVIAQLVGHPLLSDSLLTNLFDKILRSYYISNYRNSIIEENENLISKVKTTTSELTRARKDKSIIEKSRHDCTDRLQKSQETLNKLSAKKQEYISRIGGLNNRHEIVEQSLRELINKREGYFQHMHLSNGGENRVPSLKYAGDFNNLDKIINEKSSELKLIDEEAINCSMELSRIDSEIQLKEQDTDLLKRELAELTNNLGTQMDLITSLNSEKEVITRQQKTLQKTLDNTLKQLESYKK